MVFTLLVHVTRERCGKGVRCGKGAIQGNGS